MRRKHSTYVLAMVLLVFLQSVPVIYCQGAPTTLYVDDDNIFGPWDGSEDNPFRTISDAYNSSDPFGIIQVKNGTYTESLHISQAITILGEEKSVTTLKAQDTTTAITITATHVNITGFTITNSTVGLQFLNSTDGMISNNNFQRLTIGITLDSNSTGNSIYHNNFLDNINHALDTGTNSWDAGEIEGGNYWDNYTGADLNSDAFGDTPIIIAPNTNKDRYPLIQPYTQTPNAAFSYTPTAPYSYDTIIFTDLSTDQDDGIKSWRWDFGDSNTSDQQSPTHLYHKKGVYIVSLIVADHYGVTDQISTPISIQNLPPTPQFEYSPIQPTDIDEISFTDTSTDIDGEIISWLWIFGDGANSTQKNPTHTYPDNGTYTLILQITDDDNTTQQLTQQIQILNVPPIAQFILNPQKPILKDNITYQDTSIDLDGTIVAWSWDFGDDVTSTKQSPKHRYKNQGTYTITLTIIDNDGAQAQIEKTIIIVDDKPAEEVPVVSFLLYSMYIAFFIAMILVVLYIKKRFG